MTNPSDGSGKERRAGRLKQIIVQCFRFQSQFKNILGLMQISILGVSGFSDVN